MANIRNHYPVWQFAELFRSDAFRRDEGIVLAAVGRGGLALLYASYALRGDPGFCDFSHAMANTMASVREMRVSLEYHARVLDVIEVCKRHVIKGTGSMRELTQVLNRTNDLIRGNFSPDAYQAYQEYANGISRHSTNMKVLTGVMLALAAFALGALAVITVASGEIGVLPAAILA